MKIADIPTKIPVAFAENAGASYIRTLPDVSQIGITDGAASWPDGFVPDNFIPIASGGVPPFGKDMNGLGFAVSTWLRWAQAGGVPLAYDSTFSTSINGYPQGAFLRSSTLGNGKYWISTVDDNTSDPDSVSATNWIAFPDVLIQQQKPNYGVDSGVANQVIVTMSPAPASLTDIVGAPIRVKIANANTLNNPTIKINALAAITIVNPDNSVLDVGQLVVGGIMEGFVRDDNKFQITAPGKGTGGGGGTWPIPGFMMPWPTETVPSGFLECNGATLLISSYPNLYGVLGTRYGGDGVNNFKLPDYRGYFLRGWDHGRGVDPDAASRTNAGGGLTGDHVGTKQGSAAGTISMTAYNAKLYNPRVVVSSAGYDERLALSYDGSGTSSACAYVWNSFDVSTPELFIDYISGDLVLSGTSGSSETRPTNEYVMWVIAY